MSKVIENRVVELEFDNSKFTSGIKDTLSDLKDFTSGLTDLAGNFDLGNLVNSVSGISNSIDGISNRFSALGIAGATAIANIANKITDMLLAPLQKVGSTISDLTFGQISEGMTKYADKTSAVQTIMGATESTWQKSAEKLGFVGTQMEFVNSQLDKLNWFTDETSYNFVDMVSNIGKFTANNIPLEEAVTSMQGIATWAAKSGGTAAQASRAMYNLSQAIGLGSVRVQDWMSIENANMATAEFKNLVMEAAVNCGTLTKDANGVFKTIEKGTEVTVENFRGTLAEGWFDTNTLNAALHEYGEFTNLLYQLSDQSDITATNLLQLIKANKNGTLTDEKVIALCKEKKIVYEDFKNALDMLSDDTYDFGRKAFQAAQEAKTFADAINATKDAASTGWMNIFEKIFGNYEEAKNLWTRFANWMYDVLVSPLEYILDLVTAWNESGGRLILFGENSDEKYVAGICQKIDELIRGSDEYLGILGAIKEAFFEIFKGLEDPEALGNAIYESMKNMLDFLDSLKLTDEQLENVKNTAKGVFSIFKFLGEQIKNLWEVTEPLRKSLGNLINSIFEFAGNLGATITKAVDGSEKIDILKSTMEGLASIIDYVADKISKFKNNEAVINFIEAITQAINDIKKALSEFSLSDAIKSVFDGLIKTFQYILEKLQELPIIEMLTGSIWIKYIKNCVKDLVDLLVSIKTIPKGIRKVINSVKSYVNVAKIQALGEALLALAKAILIIVVALILLKYVKIENIVEGMAVLLLMMGTLIGVMKVLSNVKATSAAVAAGIVGIAIAMVILAGALAAFTLLARSENLDKGFTYMFGTLVVMVAAMAALSQIDPGKAIAAASSMLILSAAMIALAAAYGLFILFASFDKDMHGIAAFAVTAVLVAGALYVLAKNVNPLNLIAAAAAMVIFTAAIAMLAVVLGAFMLMATSDKYESGIAGLITSLILLTTALGVIGAAAPTILLGSAALLVGAIALTALAAACFEASAAVIAFEAALIGVIAVAAAFAIAIVGVILAIGAGIAGVILLIDAAIVATVISVGFLIKTIIMLISEFFKEIIASIGKGIGKGIAAIGEGIDILAVGISNISLSLSNLGTGIKNFSEGAKTLSDVKWITIATGVSAFADSLRKLMKHTGAVEILESFTGKSAKELDKISETWEKIGEEDLAGALIQGANNGFSKAKVEECFTNFESNSKEAFNSIGTRLAESAETSIAQKFISAIARGISNSNSMRSIKSSVKQLCYQISVEFFSYIPAFTTLGTYVSYGFGNGILDGAYHAVSAARTMASATVSAVATEIRSCSPSKVFMSLGEYAAEGYAIGIENESESSANAAKAMANNSILFASMASERISDILSEESAPVITPVLDLTNVRKAADGISGIVSSNSIGLTGKIQGRYAELQNGGTIETTGPQTVKFDATQLGQLIAATKNNSDVNVAINFEGSLAQLASILQPAIMKETARRGASLINA